jgi:hypothetical protein
MATAPQREHHFHAEATVLTGNLLHPLKQEIKPQTNAKLPREGGYLSEHSEPYRLEGVISFDRAYTQVAGGEDPKKPADHGWNTLSTTVVENLSVLEVITADRVVGQIATVHPKVGYVPRVYFLGTRIENLRVAGHPVKVVFPPFHPYHFDPPQNNRAYTRHSGLLERVKNHFASIRSAAGVPADLLDSYKDDSVKKEGSGANYKESFECSLVSQVVVEGAPDSIRGFGHVLHIRDFGKVHLGLLRVEHSDWEGDVPKTTLFDLTMLKFDMGCIGSGISSIGNTIINGGTEP